MEEQLLLLVLLLPYELLMGWVHRLTCRGGHVVWYDLRAIIVKFVILASRVEILLLFIVFFLLA